ncbi:uncharacterized protein LOC109714779 [Ananas comosus]|uniref:Uncharacterized protein LOC109714779 n=1 Tax=Ananas comosus TaxID=4615 RepID=A0A6P5FNN5_ANACO|nr:uncharacterized protein LOC109714779 [Ananas comosus]
MDPPINKSQFEDYHRERASSGLAHNNSFASPAISSDYIRHWADYETVYGEYYGTRAKINLWAHPDLTRSQTSSTVLWVLNFDDAPNVIEVGFHLGYHQLKAKSEDVYKTVFRMQYGHYNFTMMPYRFTNAAAVGYDEQSV